jgi:hypothetical protein
VLWRIAGMVMAMMMLMMLMTMTMMVVVIDGPVSSDMCKVSSEVGLLDGGLVGCKAGVQQ